MKDAPSRPIGIFDSGLGGLTVTHAVTRLLPHENLIYFGDTAHLPYGDKSATTIQSYCIKICDFLLQQQCKIILIACNSASTAAYELIKEYIANKAIVIDVIDPVVHHIKEHYTEKRLGLIGTKQTVHSNVFKKKIDALNQYIELCSLATPLLVPAIEEGFLDHRIMKNIIQEYLSRPALSSIDALILACTHYPLIKKQISRFYKNKVTVIDSSLIVAQALKSCLESHHLLNHHKGSNKKFYVSDYTDSFAQTAKLFFQEDLQIEYYPLWN